MLNQFNKPKLRNCPICGKLFTDIGTGVCSSCYEKQRAKEKIVIEFVREHPHTTVAEICAATGASLKLVNTMVHRGQFLSFGGKVSYPCKHCGKPILQGKYCPKCLALLNEAIRNSSERAKIKMYHTNKAAANDDDANYRKRYHLHLSQYLDKNK